MSFIFAAHIPIAAPRAQLSPHDRSQQIEQGRRDAAFPLF
jgi:hypothetical protein